MNDQSIRTNIIRIGNSQGVKLPKILLEISGIKDAVEIVANNGVIIIRPTTRKVREGWAESFQDMAVCGDDALIDVD